MTDAQLDYYKSLILDHNKNPRNYGKPDFFQFSSEGYNPLCGDKIQIYLSYDAQEKLEKISFESQACALCKASTSMMGETVIGRTKSEIDGIACQVKSMLEGQQIELENIKPLDIFSSVARYPARSKCVLLPWTTIQKAIKE